jgi:8-amino-7-oxononanoate synthase
MPTEQATEMSTAARMAATPAATCARRHSWGPRTAATMQHSVAPVAAVSTAALTSDGMSSQAARTRLSDAVTCGVSGLENDAPTVRRQSSDVCGEESWPVGPPDPVALVHTAHDATATMAAMRTVVDPLSWLGAAADERRQLGLERTLRVRSPEPDGVLDLAGNDYLGLARSPEVVAGAVAAAKRYGAGSTGSRLVTGTTPLHLQLEAELASWTGGESALVFSSGYLANIGAVTALSGPGTLVVSDERNHASLVDACRLSRARLAVTPSGDAVAVERALEQRTEERAVVVTDAVFSVSGQLAPLSDLHAAARRTGALLIVDEAHALGVVGLAGEGAVAAAGLANAPDIVCTATLSKALGSQGGVVLAPSSVREHLINTSRAFIFDTALAPPAAGAALAALRLTTPARVAALRRAAHALADALGVARTHSAVVPVPVGHPALAVRARDRCLEQGVRVGCFRPPSVPQSCLRLTARADLSDVDLARAADVVRTAL